MFDWMRIPSHATCVFSGYRFSIYQREQVQFDGSYKTFEAVKRFDSVQGIWITGNSIILPYEIQPNDASRNYWLWWWMIEDGEDIVNAIKREFLEETWMAASVQFWQTLQKSWSIQWQEHYFLIHATKKIAEPTWDAWWEQIIQKSLSFDEFIEVVVAPWFRNGNFASYVIKEFILPNKKDALHALLFWW